MFGHTALFGCLSAFISAVAFCRYAWAIKAGKTDPSKAGWIVWTVVGVMIALSYFYSDAGDSAIATFIYPVGTFFVLAACYKYGTTSFSWREYVAIVVSFSGLGFWIYFHSSVTALFIEIAVDVFGACGTFEHSYCKPLEEDVPTWTLSTCGALVNLLAVQKWSNQTPQDFGRWFYPVVVVWMCATILVIIVWRRKIVFKEVLI